MVKLYRGDVIEVIYKISSTERKTRPVIVMHNANKDSDVISIYCTSQNNGDDENNIFIEKDSDEGRLMGITKDTYIQPLKIKTIDAISVKRKIGKSSKMSEIFKIIDKHKAS